MTRLYTWKDGQRVHFAEAPSAAPAWFPYAHRTLAEVDSGEQIRNETFAEPAVCDKEMADREGAANACPGPDLDHPFEEGERL